MTTRCACARAPAPHFAHPTHPTPRTLPSPLAPSLTASPPPAVNVGEDCLSEDMQVLTEEGFMFLADLEALPPAQRDHLRFAGYDHATGHMLYEAASRIIIKPAGAQTMVEVTQGDE